MATDSHEWKRIKFTLEPSLKSLTFTSLAASLWNNDNAKDFFIQAFSSKPVVNNFSGHWSVLQRIIESKYNGNWMKLKRKIETNVQQLFIPETLKNDLVRFVDAAGNELLNWFRLHAYSFGMKEIPYKVVWTPVGTIDLVKTAEMLVLDETLATSDRFNLACFYCLEEHVFALLDQLDQDYMEKLNKLLCSSFEDIPPEDDLDQLELETHLPIDTAVQNMVAHWSFYAEEKQPLKYKWKRRGVNFYTLGFGVSINASNEIGCKYFLLQSIKNGGDNYLVDALDLELGNQHSYRYAEYLSYNHADHLSYNHGYVSHRQFTQILLLAMNYISDEQQLEIFEKHAVSVLSLFLEWPWQEHFITLHRHIGHFLSEQQHGYLFEQILFKCKENHKDYNYQEIFIALWLQTPASFKQYIYNTPRKISLYLSSLFILEDLVTFNLILKGTNEEQRKLLLLYPQLLEACKTLISGNS